jgi:hypothetical protein
VVPISYGVNTTNLANQLLNTVQGTSFVVPATWIQLHTGDPGAAGTANLSAVTTRQQATFAIASGGAIALSAAPLPFLMTTTETIVAISVWTASTGGLPLWDVALSAPQSVANGDTVTLNTCGLSIGPLSV